MSKKNQFKKYGPADNFRLYMGLVEKANAGNKVAASLVEKLKGIYDTEEMKTEMDRQLYDELYRKAINGNMAAYMKIERLKTQWEEWKKWQSNVEKIGKKMTLYCMGKRKPPVKPKIFRMFSDIM